MASLVQCAECKYYFSEESECHRYPPRLKVQLDENFELEEFNLWPKIISREYACGEGTNWS